MAETRRASNLGPLILLVRDEPTLRQALQAMARYGHLHNEALFLHVEEDDGIAVIRDEVLAGDSGPLKQATELVVGVLFRLLRFFLGDDWHPKTIFFCAWRAERPLRSHPGLWRESGIRPRVQRHRL